MESILAISEQTKTLLEYAGKQNLPKDALASVREQYLQQFADAGVPGRKHEEYKYFPAEKFLRAFSPDATFALQHQDFAPLLEEAIRAAGSAYAAALVINQGMLVHAEILDERIKIEKLAGKANAEEILKSSLLTNINDPFALYSLATFKEGISVSLASGIALDKPLIILYLNSEAQQISSSLVHIHAGENASFDVYEFYRSTALAHKSVAFPATAFKLDANAVIRHYRLQQSPEGELQVNNLAVSQDKGSVYTNRTFTLGLANVRNNSSVFLNGRHTETHLDGLFVTASQQVVDNHTLVDHRMPDCQSNELYKGILTDRSVGVFNGKIYVQRDAQKTNAYQSSKNILLSDEATINTKPQLEIYADDVKCSHGTSTGKIDEDAVFYLKARGIGEDSARKLLLHAFAGEVIERVESESLKEYLTQQVESRF